MTSLVLLIGFFTCCAGAYLGYQLRPDTFGAFVGWIVALVPAAVISIVLATAMGMRGAHRASCLNGSVESRLPRQAIVLPNDTGPDSCIALLRRWRLGNYLSYPGVLGIGPVARMGSEVVR